MTRPRHSSLIRLCTLLLLLWVGFDVGAHGFLTSDFDPMAASGSSARVGLPGDAAPQPAAPEHCFCHGIFEGASVPALVEALMPTGGVVPAISSQVPRADGHPLDRPPQL